MKKRNFTPEELNVLKTIPRNMPGKTSNLSIDDRKATFTYDLNSKKLVTVPVQVTITPVANGNVRMTLSGTHYPVTKTEVAQRQGVFLVREFNLLDKDMVFCIAVFLEHIAEAMRNLRWASHLKVAGGTWTC